MQDLTSIPGSIESLTQQIIWLKWFSVISIIIAAGSWLPWFLAAWKSRRNKPSSGSLSPCFSDRIESAIQNVLITRLLRMRTLSFILPMISVLLILSGIVLENYFSLIGSLIGLVSIPVVAGGFKNKKRIVIGSLLLWFVFFRIALIGFSDNLQHGINKSVGINAGLKVEKFRNVSWTLPVKQEAMISKINLVKPETDLLEGSYFSLIIRGNLLIEESGEYELFLISDDGSFLELDGKEVLTNPGYHPATEVKTSMFLTKGCYPLVLKYFNGTADAELKLLWRQPGGQKKLVSSDYFFQSIPDESDLAVKRLVEATFGPVVFSIIFVIAILILFHPNISWKQIYSIHAWKKCVFSITGSVGKTFRKQYWSVTMGLMIGVLAIATFWAVYKGPKMAPCTHGMVMKIFRTMTFNDLQKEFRQHSGFFNSITDPQFRLAPFSAKLEGYLYITKTGIYSLGLRAFQDAVLFVDGKRVLSFSNQYIRESSTETVSLTKGFHKIEIDLVSGSDNSSLVWTISDPGKKNFHIPSIWRLYEEPTSESDLKGDLVYQRWYRFIVALLIAALLFLFVLPFKKSIKKRGSNPAVIYPLGIIFFVLSILWALNYLNPEHRFGLLWFSALPDTFKILITIAGLLLSFPYFRQLPFKVSAKYFDIKGMRLLTFFISISVLIFGQWILSYQNDSKVLVASGLVILGMMIIMLNRTFCRMQQKDGAHSTKDINIVAIQIFCFLLILLAAAFFRFYRLQEMPPGLWWDEAQTGIVAKAILNGHFPPIYDLRINAGTLASYAVAAWFKLLDTSIFSLRSYTAFVGMITVFISFYFFRVFFNRWWSLMGMALIAISRWLFSINRVAMATIDETILLTFAVFIFYTRALRFNKYIDYISTGILLGLGFYLHTGARVLPVVIGVDLIIRMISEPKSDLKKSFKQVIIMICIAFFVALPMFNYILDHKDDYFKRSKETLLANEYPGWYPLPLLVDNFVNYMEMYPYSGDWHPRHNVDREPQLPPFISILGMIGFALCFKRYKSRESRLFLLAFFLISLQGVLTIHNGTANLNRVAENIPIVYLWAITGAVYLACGIRSIFGDRLSNYLIPVVMVGIIASSALTGYHKYFHQHLKSHSLVGVYGFDPEITEVAYYVKDLMEKDSEIQVWASDINSASFQYIFPGNFRLHDLRSDPFPEGLFNFPFAIIVNSDNFVIESRIQTAYPDAEITEVPYSLDHDFVLFKVYMVKPSLEDRSKTVQNEFITQR